MPQELSPPACGPPLPRQFPPLALLSRNRSRAGAAYQGGFPLDPLRFPSPFGLVCRVSPVSGTWHCLYLMGKGNSSSATGTPAASAAGGEPGGRRRRTGRPTIPGGKEGGTWAGRPSGLCLLRTAREPESSSRAEGGDEPATGGPGSLRYGLMRMDAGRFRCITRTKGRYFSSVSTYSGQSSGFAPAGRSCEPARRMCHSSSRPNPGIRCFLFLQEVFALSRFRILLPCEKRTLASE